MLLKHTKKKCILLSVYQLDPKLKDVSVVIYLSTIRQPFAYLYALIKFLPALWQEDSLLHHSFQRSFKFHLCSALQLPRP